MYIIAGEYQLAIIKQNVHRDNGVGLILNLEIARDSIDIGTLETTINDIAANAYEIDVYDDTDTKIAILSGFHCEPSIIAKGNVYKIELIDASENTFQLGRHKLMIQQLEEITTAQNVVITNQNEAIISQAEATALQSATIDSMLLEVLPVIIETAVCSAVEQALANNSNTTEEPTVNDTEEPVEDVIPDDTEEPVEDVTSDEGETVVEETT